MMVNLYVARKEKKLKQSDVARLLNIHAVTYSRKERGDLEFTLSEAFILANFFETTVDSLFADRNTRIY
nr:helix-turn-helix transcriptional regulator [Solibacillus daqui]